jgi:outer membrane protein OmpA-like peptidoglycan-associated protein
MPEGIAAHITWNVEIIMKRAFLRSSVSAALLLAIGLSLASIYRIHQLQDQLRVASAKAEAVAGRADAYAGHLERAVMLASAAVDHAASAADRAVQAATVRSAAEDRASSAELARLRAEEESRESLQELTAIRERRQQELNHMQEALARIASTRRTDSGVVVSLASDSFHFDFDKATLLPANRELLSRIAGVLLVSSGYRLFIDGYTDDVGTQDYNQQLSERRAAAVADYLVKAGVDRDIVQARGFGKSTPRAGGPTSEARRQNRRVELVVIDSIIRYDRSIAEEEGRI